MACEATKRPDQEYYFDSILELHSAEILIMQGWQPAPFRSSNMRAFLTPDKESDRYLLQYKINNNWHSIDFNFRSGSVLHRLKTTGRQNLLMKALGVKGQSLRILDASLGQGIDALSLLRVGCEVWGCERLAPTFVMLSAAFTDFFKNSGFDWSERFHIISGSSVDFVHAKKDEQNWDAIYYDPMFEDAAKSSKSKIQMEIFHELTGSDTDSVKTAETLLKYSPRLVIKRPPKAPSLLDLKPNHVFESKSVRYDMYLRPKTKLKP